MKLVFVCLMITFLQVNAKSFGQVTLKVTNAPLVKVIKELKLQTGYDFLYHFELLQKTKPVSLNVRNVSLIEALDKILFNQDLTYSIDNTNILITAQSPDIHNTKILKEVKVTGKVTDEKGEPIPGVTVKIKNNNVGVITSVNGNYAITVNDDNSVLIFSSIGFTSKELSINGSTTLDVVLIAQEAKLNEIVVVGYGTQRKSDLTGSIVSIKGEDIKNLPVRSVAEALQGRAAGVSVNKSSGKPGAASQIIIRGAGSINGLNPLFVIDGVPRSNTTSFDPKDVESIEIIKDASAAAIYGSQAAGGVVLISTKKGTLNQETVVDFSSTLGVREITKSYRMLETPDYIRARRAIGENYSLWNTPDLPNTNWFDELYKDGIEQSHHIAISGGSGKTNFYVSGGYEKEDGIATGNFWARTSLRVNADYHLGRRITVGHQLFMAKVSQNSATRDVPWRTLPYMAVYNSDGAFASVPPQVESSSTNEVAYLAFTHRKEGNLLLDGSLYVNYNIIDGLNFRVTGSGGFGSSFYDNFNEKNELARTATAEFYTKSAGYNESYVLNGILTYTKTFAQKHELTAMAGYELRDSFNSDLSANASDFPVQVAESFNLSINPNKIASGSLTYGRFLSQFGRINYTLNRTYLLTANIRRDGSPKFGRENRWGVFPSVSLGWKLNEETFFKNLNQNIISQIKPRVSYGILGNDAAISNFAYLPSYTPVGQHSFDGTTIVSGFNSIKVVNRNIKWEEIKTLNAGLDLGFFKDKLMISAEYYSRQTNDMLYNLPTPPSSGIAAYYSGTSTVPINIGKISNKGLEISASYRGLMGSLKYNVSGNVSRNRNKVIDLGLPLAYIYSGSLLFMKGNSPFKTVNGQPIGMIYGLIQDGLIGSKEEIDNLNRIATEKSLSSGTIQIGQLAYYNNVNTGAGDLRYKDLNGDGKITDADRTFIGNPWPKLEYGLTLDLGWKGFDASVLIYGVSGRDVINGSTIFEQSFQQDYQSTYDIFNASYFLGNGLTSQPRLGTADPGNPAAFIKDPNGNYASYSSYFVENASFLKIKNITLGYLLPSQALKSLGLRKIRIFVIGQNLFTFTKFSGLDPEFSNDVKNYGLYGINSYPQTKFFSGGLEVSF